MATPSVPKKGGLGLLIVGPKGPKTPDSGETPMDSEEGEPGLNAAQGLIDTLADKDAAAVLDAFRTLQDATSGV